MPIPTGVSFTNVSYTWNVYHLSDENGFKNDVRLERQSYSFQWLVNDKMERVVKSI